MEIFKKIIDYISERIGAGDPVSILELVQMYLKGA